MIRGLNQVYDSVRWPWRPIIVDVVLWPVASSCAISCCAQVLRAAHLHRRAAGIAHQPCWLKSKGQRTPGRPVRGPHDDAQREDPTSPSVRTPHRPARGPQDAQREDPTSPSARTPRCPARGAHDMPPFWIRPKSSPRILRGTLDTRTWTHAPRTLQL